VVTNLNADLLDGFNSAQASTVSTVAVRDADGDITARTYHAELANQATISGAIAFRVNNSSDNILRYCNDTPAIRTFLDVPTRSGTNATGTWAISISGNATTATDLVNDAPFIRTRGTIAESGQDTATANGMYLVNKTGFSSSMLAWNVAGSSGPVQIDVNFNDTIRYRNQTDSVTWTAWKTFLHSSNFNTYSPTNAGVGATGTWPIGISGNAATVTNGVYTNTTQTISGTKTFSSTIISSVDTGTEVLRVGSAAAGITKITNENGLAMYADSSLVLFAGDTYTKITAGRGIVAGTTSEDIILAADGTIVFLPGQQNGYTTVPQASINASGTLTAVQFVETSSIAYKENVNPIDSALDKVLQLVGVTYDRKNSDIKNEAGLIAEEVAKVIPNIVSEKEGKPDGIQYTKLTAYLIECIKELNAKIERLEGKQ
jgi:hypothetical protein